MAGNIFAFRGRQRPRRFAPPPPAHAGKQVVHSGNNGLADLWRAAADQQERISLMAASLPAMTPYDERKESLPEFFSRITDIFSLGDISVARAKLLVASLLRGEARARYDDIPANVKYGETTSFEEFLEALSAVLVPESERLLNLEVLRTLCQAGETVSHFAAQVRSMGEKAFPCQGHADVRDLACRNAFIDGLVTSIRLDVRKARPLTFQKAVEIARSMELAMRAEQRRKRNDDLEDIVRGINSMHTEEDCEDGEDEEDEEEDDDDQSEREDDSDSSGDEQQQNDWQEGDEEGQSW